MTLTNTDASRLTARRMNKALYSWKRANDMQVNLGKTVLSEQSSQQSGLVVLERQLGASTCGCDSGLDASKLNYPFVGGSNNTHVQ